MQGHGAGSITTLNLLHTSSPAASIHLTHPASHLLRLRLAQGLVYACPLVFDALARRLVACKVGRHRLPGILAQQRQQRAPGRLDEGLPLLLHLALQANVQDASICAALEECAVQAAQSVLSAALPAPASILSLPGPMPKSNCMHCQALGLAPTHLVLLQPRLSHRSQLLAALKRMAQVCQVVQLRPRSKFGSVNSEL